MTSKLSDKREAGLRILASYGAKTASMNNFWTFWAIIQMDYYNASETTAGIIAWLPFFH